MKVFFLGAYSAAGMQGMMNSTYAARVSAVKKMVEKVGGKLGTVTYLQGPFDVIADVEVDDYETASGLHANMMLSRWDLDLTIYINIKLLPNRLASLL